MTARYAWIALAAAGAFGLAACETDSTTPASSGPATAGSPNSASQGSNSSGQPTKPRSSGSETPPATPGSP